MEYWWGGINHSILDMLRLKCLFNIQAEMMTVVYPESRVQGEAVAADINMGVISI